MVGEPFGGSFGEAEVAELDVTLLVEEEILGLEVSVDNGQGVQVLESAGDLGGEEVGRVVGKLDGVAQVGEQLAAAHVLEQHVEERVVVRRPEEVDDERMVD